MTRRFVITGPPGSGKTPVLRELASRGSVTVPEPAREVIAAQRKIDARPIYDRDPKLFLNLMLDRAIADHRAASAEAVFFDRGIPDQIGYAEIFGRDASRAREAAQTHRYEPLVFVLPAWPEIYTTDEDRRMSFEQAEAFGVRVRTIYEELGYTVVDVPRDGIEARAAFIVESLPSAPGERSHGAR